jgi:DNA-binding MarR family transcriptional regulator
MSEGDYKALGDFRRAMRTFLAFSAEGARDHGLTSQQHQALLAVRTHTGPEAMTIGELADCLLIKNHSAIGLVARLVERGLVDRTTSQNDRRRVLVGLTPAGAEVLEIISVRNLAQLNRAAEILAGILKTTRKMKADGA